MPKYSHDIQTLDLVFNYADGSFPSWQWLKSRGIQLFQGGCPWIHVGIVVIDNGVAWVVESTQPRVRKLHLDTVIKKRRVGIRRVPWYVPYGLDMATIEKEAKETLFGLVGMDYPEIQIARIAARTIIGIVGDDVDEGIGLVDIHRPYVCSALGSAVIDMFFHYDICPGRRHWETRPKDEWNSTQLDTVTDNLLLAG